MVELTKEKDLLFELEEQINECKKTVYVEDPKLFDSNTKIKEAVLLQAYNLNLLIRHYPKLYPYKQCSIVSTIINEYRRNSVTKKTLDAIYDAFRDPEYNIYKTHVYNTAKRKLESEQEIEEQAIGEKYIVDTQMSKFLEYARENIDHPKMQAFIQEHAKIQEKQENKERKEKEDEDKVTIPRPDWLEPETEEEKPKWIPAGVEGRMSLTAAACKKISEAWHDIAIRVYQYPPKEKEDDKYYAEGIETLHALIVPGTDLKYVRDTLSYLDITLEKETQSIHSAMSKSKIKIPPNSSILTEAGKWNKALNLERKLTREQIADIAPQMIILSIWIIQKIPGLVKFCLYLLREQKTYSGLFHINRHDKLSESAFGKSSFVD